MTHLELLTAIQPYTKLPPGEDWTTLPEPACPECHAGMDAVQLSRLPLKYGNRGNPTLKCRECGRTWSYPSIRRGGPIKVIGGLTKANIETIEKKKIALGVDKTTPYMKALRIPELHRDEVRGVLDTTPEIRERLYTLVGTVAIEDIARELGLSVSVTNALARGYLWRKGRRRGSTN